MPMPISSIFPITRSYAEGEPQLKGEKSVNSDIESDDDQNFSRKKNPLKISLVLANTRKPYAYLRFSNNGA